MKIYLSPSTQSKNIYAYGGTNEMEECNKIAECAETHLLRNGFSVKVACKGKTMYSAINESNEYGADIHIPIHTNAANGKCGGTLVMVYDKSETNMAVATPIYDNVQAVTPGTTLYGIRINKDLAELKLTKAPAVYIECDFHDNARIANWIISNSDTLGKSICKGICEYAKVPFKEENEPIYRVQVGAYKDLKNAEQTATELKQKGYQTIIK